MIGHHRVPLLLLALSLTIASCRQAPVFNPRVEFAPRTPNMVEEAILKALANRKWIARTDGPGVIIGTLNLRDHQAVVRIEYTDESYSVRHTHSTELLYQRKSDGTELIHKNYNAWIAYLVNDINAALGIPPVDDRRMTRPESWVKPDGTRATRDQIDECIRRLKLKREDTLQEKLLLLGNCMKDKGFELD